MFFSVNEIEVEKVISNFYRYCKILGLLCLICSSLLAILQVNSILIQYLFNAAIGIFVFAPILRTGLICRYFYLNNEILFFKFSLFTIFMFGMSVTLKLLLS